MCELLAMSSRRSTRLTVSLKALAAHGGSAGRNRDGWGVAFHDGNDAALFREPTPAGDSRLAKFLEAQGPSTTLAIAHIRHATRGAITLSNTQPFLRELAGRAHVFAHNGDLPAIDDCDNLAYDRYCPIGTTDSERAFCALLERVRGLWVSSTSPPPLEARFAVVSQFAADLRPLGPANFLYADGATLFAHGHRRIQPATGAIELPGLFVLSRRCREQTDPVDARAAPATDALQEVVLIASVPLTDEHWRPLAEGEIVAVSAGRILGAATSVAPVL